MQFFHLFSFVVIVSHTSALPQLAELSEQYSNSVDTNLASLFETISYQSVLNTREDSVTLVSLERRANSGGSSGGNSAGTGTPPSPESTSDKAKNTISTVFGDGAFSCMKLSSTIEKVGNGIAKLPNDIRKIVDMIGGDAGKTLEFYFKKALYVNTVLQGWVKAPGENIISIIKSGLGTVEYPKVEPSLKQTAAGLTAKIQTSLLIVVKAVSYLFKKIGFISQNLEAVHISFKDIFRSYMMFFEELKPLLLKFSAGKVYHVYLSDICKSLDKFLVEQQQAYDIFTIILKASPHK